MVKIRKYSDEELMLIRGIIPDGIYKFKTTRAEEKISRNNNEMIILEIDVTVDNHIVPIRDSLMTDGKMAFKIKHFFKSIGRLDIYNKENIEMADFTRKEGHLKIKVKTDDKTGFTKSEVVDYISFEELPAGVADKDLNDDLPF